MNARLMLSTLLAAAVLGTGPVAAADHATNTVGAGGYDLVSYQTGKRPLRGNGNHVVSLGGATYLFLSGANAETFKRNPDKYLPAFGGFCAYGVSVGKKFHADPEVWRVVDGRLYLNLDTGIQDLWLADVPGRVQTATKQWHRIRDRSPAAL